MIREFEFIDRTWYVVSRRYPTEAKARYAFERLDVEAKRARGALELGCYRHQYLDDDRAVYVTAIGHVRAGAEAADRSLTGEPFELEDVFVEAMIGRRIRVMAELEGVPSGSYVVRRPEGRGGHLRPDGTVDEPIGHG
jgi:hypothetical protein